MEPRKANSQIQCAWPGEERCPAMLKGAQCLGVPAHGGEHVYKFDEIVEGIKFDQEKLRWDLLPWQPLEQVVAVLHHGAAKYAPYNWQAVATGPDGYERYLAAALRHIKARATGEHLDPDSAFPHLAHAVCCLLFLLWRDEAVE